MNVDTKLLTKLQNLSNVYAYVLFLVQDESRIMLLPLVLLLL